MLDQIKIIVFAALAATPLLAAETALHRAVRKEAPEAVEKLADQKILEARDAEGKTAVFIAAEVNRVDLVRLLAERGASLQVVDAQKESLMHIAALHGNTEMAHYLVTIPVNLLARNRRGLLPVDVADMAGHRDIVELLIANGSPLPRGHWNALTLVLYGLYLCISIALTVWVARTLSKNGRIFLVDAFSGNEKLADAVNHLLVVGFYLVNIGYLTLALRERHKPKTVEETIETLSIKIGLVLLILGAMHFFNMFMFGRLRRKVAAKAEQKTYPLPAAE